MIVEICNVLNVDITDEILLQIVLDDLTYDNPLYKEAIKAFRSTRGIKQVLKNFTYSNGLYQLPRGYFSRLCDIAQELNIPIEFTDSRAVVPFDSQYNHSIQLREYQLPALTELSKYSEGLLVAPAGSGKTIIGIAAILMCGQRSLWITHTKQLLFQFIDRIQKFVDIPDTDIGLIYNGKWDVDKPVTAALVQTLRTDTQKLQEISKNFGTIITDECHHQPSTTFTEVVSQLNPYYLFGLTATPRRRDGLENVLFQNLGPIRYTIPRADVAGGVLTPVINTRYIDTPGIPDEVTYQKLLQILAKSEFRNNIIIKDVVAQAVAGNICIVLTERVSHAETLFNKIKKLWLKTGIMVGKNSDKLRDKTLTELHNSDITVLICTSQLLGEGFDFAPLNRLFIGLPFRDIAKCEQLVGRVQRISPGKIDAIIFDYVDNHGLPRHQFKNFGDSGCRYNVYRKLGCKILQ